MNRNKDSQWLASHIFYAEPLDKFVTDAIIPFVKKVKELNIIEGFFFIRYWERGPHIRLRFLGDLEVFEEKLKPLYKSYFDQFFSEHPSVRKEPDYVKELKDDQKWFPNNTVQFLPYEPETERYGGNEMLIHSEAHFQFSSETIFEFMEDGKDGWGYDLAMGAAIQMHLSMVYGFGMDKNEMIHFFDRYFVRWLSRAYYYYGQEIEKEELERRRDETLVAFEKSYQPQKESFISFFTQIQELLTEGDIEDSWLEHWVNGAKLTNEKLDDLIKSQTYEATNYYEIFEKFEYNKEIQSKWALFDSYVHMTNNRLGVLNRDEAYLAYIIKETLKVI